jgi:hypothetical protein
MTFLTKTLLATIVVAALPTLAEGQDLTQTSSAPPSQIILVLPAVEAPHPACDAPPTTAPAPAQVAIADDLPEPELTPRPFRLGLSGLVGTRDDGTGIAPTWTAGIDVGLRLTPREDGFFFVDVSLRRITAGGADTIAGERFAIGASPAVSVGGRVAERIEIYAEVGVGLQTRFGSQATAAGVAPFGGGGVRFYFTDFFSLAIEGAMHIPATHGFLLGTEVFPQAAAIFQGGLALAFHLG